tara:strand:+ start:496 stop:888 length:393 start_codon:yes stop_codon:yes gene_type:complete
MKPPLETSTKESLVSISIKDLTPEQREAAVALFVQEQAKVGAKDRKRISRIVNPAGWTIQKNETATGVVYLSVHNQSCHGNSKGWSFRGTTLPFILGDIEATSAFPLSGSKLIIEELRAWNQANPDSLTP